MISALLEPVIKKKKLSRKLETPVKQCCPRKEM